MRIPAGSILVIGRPVLYCNSADEYRNFPAGKRLFRPRSQQTGHRKAEKDTRFDHVTCPFYAMPGAESFAAEGSVGFLERKVTFAAQRHNADFNHGGFFQHGGRNGERTTAAVFLCQGRQR